MSRERGAVLCGLREYFSSDRASPVEGRFLPASLVPGACRLVGSRPGGGGLDAHGIPEALRTSCHTSARGMTMRSLPDRRRTDMVPITIHGAMIHLMLHHLAAG